MQTARADTETTSLTALWAALVAALTVGGSFIFACVAPLAAIGALAALTMKRVEGLLLVIGAWAANQFVGFVLLSYPYEANTIGWGVAIGVASVCGYFAAAQLTSLKLPLLILAPLALLVSFVAYELVLYVYGLAVSDTGETFTAAMVSDIFVINAVGFAALFALHRAGVALSLLRAPDRGTVADA